jgi:transmembrane sensor
MNEKELNDLLGRYIKEECTPDEIVFVNSWFNHAAREAASAGKVPDFDALQQRVWDNMGIRHKRTHYLPVLGYAATILLLIVALFALFQRTTHKPAIAFDIQPGGNRAVLTLANGKQISLNGQNGAVSTNPDIRITNDTSSGIVTYQVQNNKGTNDGINTINTPKGGQYQLVLPDGTRVFLNAASSLQFPSRFTSTQRKVNLVGEAYFEVVKNSNQPFLVITEGQQLKVLGTHFNVSAYPSESVTTTLAEGSVEILQPSTNLTQLLLPNQQSELLSTGFKIKTVNVADEIAWKDGLFVFAQTPLKNALQQISRWYDVEVDYTDLPNTILVAALPRTLTLAEMLKDIELSSKVKIELNGGKLKYTK